MAVTLSEISGWLDNREIKHGAEEEDSKIIFVFTGDKTIGIKVELEEDGELVQLYANLLDDEDRGVVRVKEHEHLPLVLQHILTINYNEKFGAWEFDPSDGEVRFAVEIPLEDASMTEKQFNRILGHVLNSEEHFVNILKILETGELPKDDDDSDPEAMFELLKNMVLKQALEQHGGDMGALLDDVMAKKSKAGDEGGI